MIEVKLKLNKHANDEVRKKFTQLSKMLSGPQMDVAQRKTEKALHGFNQRLFRTKGAAVGGWPPYKYGGRIVRKGYLGRDRKGSGAVPTHVITSTGKKRLYYINTRASLLEDIGDLKKSFKTYSTRKNVVLGSDLEYSITHEEGNKSKGVKQRRLLPDENNRQLNMKLIRIYNTLIEQAKRK